MRRLGAVSLGLALAVFASGCQNQITVRVDAVLGVTSTHLDPESYLGQRIDARIRDLGELIDRCEKVDLAMTQFVQTRPPEETDAARLGLKDYRAVVQGVAAEAATLREELRDYYAAPDILTTAGEARDTARRAEAFFERSGESLRKWHAAAGRVVGLQDLTRDARLGNLTAANGIAAWDEVGAEVARAVSTTSAARRPPIGFGGFTATDAYAINPSDPKYQQVLGGKGTRFATLTKATFGASGDSAVMMVMEHPGQIRVYQVSNDPTQVTRNVGLLVSKATQAAAKFAVMP